MLLILVSFACALAIAVAARALGWLTADGAVAATFIGGSVFAFLGWPGAVLLMLFFVSSSLLTRLNRSRRDERQAGASRVTASPTGASRTATEDRTRGRDARQVLANGLVAGLAAVWAGLAGDGAASLGLIGGELPGGAGPWLSSEALSGALLPRLVMAGAMAAATADTWATEIGTWAGGVPRSPLTARAMKPGESGGMTVFGTFGGLVGAALIGQAALWLWDDFGLRHAVSIEIAGFAGMWFDSVLGASIQYKAVCPACGRVVEERDHVHPVERRTGLGFVDNDVVNLVATIAGGVLAAVAASV